MKPVMKAATSHHASKSDAELKERVRAFWQENPCGSKFSDVQPGTPSFYETIEAHRYATEWHIPLAADFAGARGLRVLEIGCGLATDGALFAKAGAHYTGIDLTDAAINLARQNFAWRGLTGEFEVADAENVRFPDESFDIVYSHGVLHHTPDTQQAVREIHRVLRPNGRAIVMLYHRDSYNYRINIRLLRRGGVQLLRWEPGVKLVHFVTREPLESLREHARRLRQDTDYLHSGEFLSGNTDGAGNPLARVYAKSEARELFRQFAKVEMKTYFLNKRFLPLIGSVLPISLESSLARRWGWHLWIYATK